jgi:hypothetical protein
MGGGERVTRGLASNGRGGGLNLINSSKHTAFRGGGDEKGIAKGNGLYLLCEHLQHV